MVWDIVPWLSCQPLDVRIDTLPPWAYTQVLFYKLLEIIRAVLVKREEDRADVVP
jgi:hypothetical protein